MRPPPRVLDLTLELSFSKSVVFLPSVANFSFDVVEQIHEVCGAKSTIDVPYYLRFLFLCFLITGLTRHDVSGFNNIVLQDLRMRITSHSFVYPVVSLV